MGDVIDLSVLRTDSSRRLAAGLINTNVETENPPEIVTEHSAEPIKRLEDIERTSTYLLDNHRFRDNMLFIIGINVGLRVSDLRVLRFFQLINPNCTFKDKFPVFEQKTRNTRKRKMNRYITINTAVIEAVTVYLENTPGVTLNDYLFRSESNRETGNKPLSTKSIDRILKGIADDLGLNMRVSTHTLRKTFCYHQMLMSHNDSRKLLLLQKMLNHSSPAQTLDYIGITSEEIDEAYKSLNLGSIHNNYMVNSNIIETTDDVI